MREPDMDTLVFFEGHPAALELYRVFEDLLYREFPCVNRRVQKTQITFYNRHVFACVSFARVKKKAELNVDPRMIRILRDTLLDLDHAGHMIIIKTMSGSANVAGEVIDNLGLPEILGTIAGDNTILAVVRHEQDAGEVADRIRSMIET